MDVDVQINNLQNKVITEFECLLSRVKKGYKPDYELILEEVSFIELIENGELDDRFAITVLQFYLNHQWQTTQF